MQLNCKCRFCVLTCSTITYTVKEVKFLVLYVYLLAVPYDMIESNTFYIFFNDFQEHFTVI
jgi:hypothetical protein